MMVYNWQQKDWPHFRYRLEEVESRLFEFERNAGTMEGMSKALPPHVQLEQMIDTMLIEAIKTSEIEGVLLSRKDVLSSIKKNLGLNAGLSSPRDKKSIGIADMLIDVRNTYLEPLKETKLFEWHVMLMADTPDIQIGEWRTHQEPMQIVSGAISKEKIHFEAPPSKRVPNEMKKFIAWYNHSAPGGKDQIISGVVRSAVAHLYFESIHPFEDGNGRIGRAISEKVLAQNLGRPLLFSLSGTIESKKNNYYNALEKAQRSNEITPWIVYFIDTILEAQSNGLKQIRFTLHKTQFFDSHNELLNERQEKVIRRMFEAGPIGFEGGMNTRKYIAIAKTSKATATRDLQDLVGKKILILNQGGGRSTSYSLNIPA